MSSKKSTEDDENALMERASAESRRGHNDDDNGGGDDDEEAKPKAKKKAAAAPAAAKKKPKKAEASDGDDDEGEKKKAKPKPKAAAAKKKNADEDEDGDDEQESAPAKKKAKKAPAAAKKKKDEDEEEEAPKPKAKKKAAAAAAAEEDEDGDDDEDKKAKPKRKPQPTVDQKLAEKECVAALKMRKGYYTHTEPLVQSCVMTVGPEETPLAIFSPALVAAEGERPRGTLKAFVEVQNLANVIKPPVGNGTKNKVPFLKVLSSFFADGDFSNCRGNVDEVPEVAKKLGPFVDGAVIIDDKKEMFYQKVISLDLVARAIELCAPAARKKALDQQITDMIKAWKTGTIVKMQKLPCKGTPEFVSASKTNLRIGGTAASIARMSTKDVLKFSDSFGMACDGALFATKLPELESLPSDTTLYLCDKFDDKVTMLAALHKAFPPEKEKPAKKEEKKAETKKTPSAAAAAAETATDDKVGAKRKRQSEEEEGGDDKKKPVPLERQGAQSKLKTDSDKPTRDNTVGKGNPIAEVREALNGTKKKVAAAAAAAAADSATPMAAEDEQLPPDS